MKPLNKHLFFLTDCCGLNDSVALTHPNSYVEILTPKVTLGGGVLVR